MVSVEKRQYPDSHSPRSTVGFIVNPEKEENDNLVVELNPFDPDESTIRVMDETGNVLLHEDQDMEDSGRVEFTVNNLNAGTYYFEVSDGFYYQVKEVRVPD